MYFNQIFFIYYNLKKKIIYLSKKNLLFIYQGDPKKPRIHKLIITSTKIKQNNSNFVHSNFWTCW